MGKQSIPCSLHPAFAHTHFTHTWPSLWMLITRGYSLLLQAGDPAAAIRPQPATVQPDFVSAALGVACLASVGLGIGTWLLGVAGVALMGAAAVDVNSQIKGRSFQGAMQWFAGV
jgi:hypothetical protein